MSAVIEYEVSLEVDDAIADDYLSWLHGHIEAMLALPGFVGAELLRVHEPAPAGRTAWCVRYRLCDAAALDAYLGRHAPAMRAEGRVRFGERFAATRRVLVPEPAPVAAPQQLRQGSPEAR